MVTDPLWRTASELLGAPAAFATTTPGAQNTGSGAINNPNTIVLFDPLKGETLLSLSQRIIDGLLLIAIPVVTIMVMIGAYYLITSGGNPARRTKGKDYILWAAVGFGVLLLADSVALIVKNFIMP